MQPIPPPPEPTYHRRDYGYDGAFAALVWSVALGVVLVLLATGFMIAGH